MLSGLGMGGVVTRVATLLDAPTVVLDDHQRVLAHAGVSGDSFGLRLAAEGVSPELRERPALADAFSDIRRGTACTIAPVRGITSRPRLVVPVIAGKEILGSIWVEAEEVALEDHRALVEQAARVVALEMLREQSIAEVERNLRRELLDDRLAENPPASDVLQRKAARLGVALDDSFRLCVVKLPAGQSSEPAAVSRHRNELIVTLRAKRWCALAADHLGYVVALLTEWDEDVRAALAGVLEPPNAGTRAVVSAQCKVAEYRRGFTDARTILELLAHDASAEIIDLEEARVLALLFGNGDLDQVRRFVDACLAPVRSADSKGRLDLVNTLDAYLESGCSPVRTAATLHLHVNSVYYRRRALKSALGEDFATPRRALDLQVACLGRRLLGDR